MADLGITAPQTLGQMLRATAARYPSKAALFYKEAGKYSGLSWSEVLRRAESVASFLVKEGLVAGDRLAIFSENRPEWAMVDLASQMIGVSTVPIYPSLTAVEVQYLLKDSGARVLAVSQKSLFEKIPGILASLPELRAVIGFDSALSLYQKEIPIPLRSWAEAEKTPLDPSLRALADKVTPETLASLIYTSGTTGVPKGVMLTHHNFIQNVIGCKRAFQMRQSDAHLSFLPLCHVFERTTGYYLMVYIGASIAYAESLETVPANIAETRPTFLLGVPRFYEKTRARVTEAVQKAGPMRQGLFLWAKELRRKERCGEKVGLRDRALKPLADVLVYKKFRQRLGGRIRFCVSGGAPLAKELAEFFYDLGVLICEGYGLTETAPVMTANREDRWRFGSVGVALEGVDIKVTSEGEIITRSSSVMRGYYRKPEETAEVLKDGWFYTGDLGHLDKEGFLFITGRKKEILVTSGGKKVSPRPIEELLEQDPFILRAVLYGEGKKYITALIVPRMEALLSHAEEQKIAFSRPEDLLKDKKVVEFMDGRVQNLQKDLASYEKIKYFVLRQHDFTQAAGELTPTLKVKREVALSRHRAELDTLYAGD